MRKICSILLIAIISFFVSKNESNAQVNSILVKGKIVDTITYDNIIGTSISIIKASDSTLINFTRCNEDGDFSLKINEPGDYIILYSHNTFAQFVDEKYIPKEGIDLGEIALLPKSTLLKEIVITENRAITIKGDTVEYNADSFKVREFASVEELLKKLPGIEVDANGNITAHGEKVQKMLVDGDEFFSDDPIVLSKMLRASSVSTVQVFDDKSEQSKFTGIDDGVKEKTINLKLKDDAKRGMFGKVEIGGGLPDYWENSGILNMFKNKQKLAIYGVMSNTNKTGLGWNDMRGMGDNSIEMSDDGMTITSSMTSDEFSSWDGRFNGQGLPKTWNGGIHFSDKFGEKENHVFSSDFRFNKNNIYSVTDNITEYNFVDTYYINNSHSETKRSQISNIYNGKYKWDIDSTQNIQIKARGNYNLFQSDNNSNSYNELGNGTLINENIRNTKSEGQRLGGNIDVLYRKKFKVKGRTFSTQAILDYNQSQSESDFNSISNYILLGASQEYNQYKTDSTQSRNSKITFTYSEPIIADVLSITTHASIALNNKINKNYSFDRVGSELILNDTFSNNFDYNVNIYSGGASFNINKEKYVVNVGGNVSYTDFLLINHNHSDYKFQRNYVNFNPTASFRTKDARNFDLRINYNGSTRQPQINQLQPIRQNTDPLNISVGNMDLDQEFAHNINFNIGKYKVLQQRFLYMGGGITYVANAISTDQYLQPDGVRVYTYYNSTGNTNGYIYSGYSFKPKGWEPRLSANLFLNYNSYMSKLNYVEALNRNISISPSFNIDWARDTTIIVNYKISASYNIANSNNATFNNNNFLSTNQNIDASYRFGNGITIGTDINWILREKTNEFDKNNSLLIWNAFISKSFLKDNSLVIKLYGNDLLNQNIGFNQWFTNNARYETFNNTIKRYGMLSIAWNFTKSKSMVSDNTLKEEENVIQEADSNPDSYIDVK